MRDQGSTRLRAHADARAYCDGKARFRSYTLADRLAKKQRERDQSSNQVYHCAKCNGFHIGELVAGRRIKSHRRRRMELEEMES